MYAQLRKDRGFLEAALDSVVMAYSAGRIVEFNPSAPRLFGFERAHVIGKSLANLIVPPALRPRHHEAYEEFVSTGS